MFLIQFYYIFNLHMGGIFSKQKGGNKDENKNERWEKAKLPNIF